MPLLALFLACLQTPAPAAPAAPAAQKPIALVPHWEIGPLLHLEFVRGREDWEDEKLVKASKTVTPVDVEVLAKSETGWVIRWTYGHTSVVEGAGKDKDYAERMASLNEGMRLDVRLKPAGAVDGLADAPGLQRHYSRMLQEVEKGLLEKGLNARVVAQMMRESTERVLGAGFEREALVEVELLHRCFVVPLVPGRQNEYEGELPNPFGGDPFPALGSYELAAPEPGARELAVRFALAIDPAKTRELVLAWMTELAKRNGKPPPQGPDDLPLKGLEETTRYVLDLGTCLPRSVENERTTRIERHKRVDRTILRVVQVPAPEKAPEKPR